MTQTVAVNSETELQNLIRDRFGHEPDWMTQRRLQAAIDYFALDWPRLERTPLKKRKLGRIPFFEHSTPAIPQDFRKVSGIELRLYNNHLAVVNLPDSLKEAGVVLEPLADAINREPVREFLGSLAPDAQDKITAINDALWQNGLFLWVPPHLSEIVEVSFENYADASSRALITKNLIICGSESRVIVTERLSAEDAPEKMLLAENTEIFAENGGRVEFGAIQQCGHHVEGFIRRVGLVSHDAAIDWNIGEFGSGLIVSGHESKLSQQGASTRSTTVFFGSQQQHQDYTAKSFHQAPNTTSNMVARGVMKDKARSIFTGLTHIAEGAKGSDGRQKEQTLMLSDGSRADAIPSLLIDERDVYAAHAASAGPVDKAAVFYLMSRGLSEDEAVRLIVHGFLAPVIDTIPREALRDEVWAAVEGKIME